MANGFEVKAFLQYTQTWFCVPTLKFMAILTHASAKYVCKVFEKHVQRANARDLHVAVCKKLQQCIIGWVILLHTDLIYYILRRVTLKINRSL